MEEVAQHRIDFARMGNNPDSTSRQEQSANHSLDDAVEPISHHYHAHYDIDTDVELHNQSTTTYSTSGTNQSSQLSLTPSARIRRLRRKSSRHSKEEKQSSWIVEAMLVVIGSCMLTMVVYASFFQESIEEEAANAATSGHSQSSNSTSSNYQHDDCYVVDDDMDVGDDVDEEDIVPSTNGFRGFMHRNHKILVPILLFPLCLAFYVVLLNGVRGMCDWMVSTTVKDFKRSGPGAACHTTATECMGDDVFVCENSSTDSSSFERNMIFVDENGDDKNVNNTNTNLINVQTGNYHDNSITNVEESNIEDTDKIDLTKQVTFEEQQRPKEQHDIASATI